MILDSTGSACGIGFSGASNYHDVGKLAASHEIDRAVRSAIHQAKIETDALDSAFLGMAGVLSDDDRREVQEAIAGFAWIPDIVTIENDAVSALAGALSGRPGVVQIAGTGSVTFGKDSSGKSWRAGGWGDRLADEGSASWMGMEAMKAAVQAFDGRGDSTALLHVVIERLGLTHPYEILHRLYVDGIARSRIAAMAPVVFSLAESGDPSAIEIVNRGAFELSHSIATVIGRLDFSGAVEIALVGGVFGAGKIFRTPFKAELDHVVARYRFVEAELPPVAGAAILALEKLDPGFRMDQPQTLSNDISRLQAVSM